MVLGCETSQIRFAEMARLLDHGFANYETVQFAEAGERIKKVDIAKGDDVTMYAVTDEDIGLTVKKGNKSNVKKKVDVDSDIKLPVEKGQKVGSLTIYEGDEEAARYDLVSDRDIKRADLITTYIRMIKKLI